MFVPSLEWRAELKKKTISKTNAKIWIGRTAETATKTHEKRDKKTNSMVDKIKSTVVFRTRSYT